MNYADESEFPVATRAPPPPGTTLRDYFAASALQGLTTRRPAGVPTSAAELARFAYEIADAMLAARTQTAAAWSSDASQPSGKPPAPPD